MASSKPESYVSPSPSPRPTPNLSPDPNPNPNPNQDISKLERYVGESASVLLFLSRGYFKSLNCLREVRAFVAAKRADQGLILVRETAPTHGAASLEELRAECPPDLAAEVFTRAHLQLLIPFYRQARGGGWVGASRC